MRNELLCLREESYLPHSQELHPVRYVASLGWITQVIGYSFITGITTILGYFILKGMHPDTNPMLPVLFICMIGYIVGCLYSMVFQMAVDTALQCFIITEEQGGGDPSYVPELMASFFSIKEDEQNKGSTDQGGKGSNQQ